MNISIDSGVEDQLDAVASVVQYLRVNIYPVESYLWLINRKASKQNNALKLVDFSWRGFVYFQLAQIESGLPDFELKKKRREQQNCLYYKILSSGKLIQIGNKASSEISPVLNCSLASTQEISYKLEFLLYAANFCCYL
ncbi:hypothetical protein BpHYR1_010818 [Brachionus plicatilis]|uniref:Uncharacterized protein n=1 Tax=Brachionus plicatilis TaxID=10195 RepID=A0A3M7QGJ6_BRAPC|nr:hypothetical protein BpHYR1_010818 [Brachionus plicatilis]